MTFHKNKDWNILQKGGRRWKQKTLRWPSIKTRIETFNWSHARGTRSSLRWPSIKTRIETTGIPGCRACAPSSTMTFHKNKDWNRIKGARGSRDHALRWPSIKTRIETKKTQETEWQSRYSTMTFHKNKDWNTSINNTCPSRTALYDDLP